MLNYKKSMGALIGNTMQFYDFTLYAFLAPQIKHVFFDFENQYLSYLVVFGVFACGYLTRPIGSLLFGSIGDRKGRSYALSITIILATVTTVAIGLLPGYKSLGWTSPILLLLLRWLQGIAVSGEEGSAVVLLFEKYAFKNQRLIGSAVLSSVLFGVLLGIAACIVVVQIMSQDAFNDWGWRLPFLLALPLGGVATVFRFYINDFKLFELAEKNNLIIKHPVKSLLKTHWSSVISGFFIVVAYSVTTSTIIVHIPYFLTVKLGYSQSHSLFTLAFAIILMMTLSPLFAHWFKKISVFAVYRWSLFTTIALIPGVFYIFSTGNMIEIIMATAILAVFTAIISSTIFALLVRTFPFGIRCTGVSLSFNLCITIFSSSTPVALIFIENNMDSSFAPGLYIASLLFFSLLATSLLRGSHQVNINKNCEESFLYQPYSE